jgi:uncharacterized membrane protein YkvA (DUF1232 family)
VEVVVSVVVGLLAVWLVLIAVLWILRPRDVAIREIVRLIPDVLRLVRNLLGDRSAPLGVRVALAILIVWLVSPIDLIPEFIPILGPLDDAIVAVIVLRFVRRRLGDTELRARWAGSPAGYDLLARLLGGSAAA